jgi:hypothetical protein
MLLKCSFSDGKGLCVYASCTITARTRIQSLAWSLWPVADSLPLLGDGRIDSYARVRVHGPLCFLAGPASLINGACDKHANSSLKLTSKVNSCCWIGEQDVSTDSEITIVYGDESRCDLLCDICLRRLCISGGVAADHVPVLEEFSPSSFQPHSTADRVRALSNEAKIMRRHLIQLRLK